MRIFKIPAAIRDICKKGNALITVVYECYHCGRSVRGTQEEARCHQCGRLSCHRCLIECEECGQKICYDCHVMCRSCYTIICPGCAPKCRNCGRPVCVGCSLTCDKCSDQFCSGCILTSAGRLSYLCPGIITYEHLCDECYQEFPELETALENEAGVTALSEDSYEVDSKTYLVTSLFEEKEEALKSLRVTAAFLNLDTIAGVSYTKHRVYNGNYVYYVWQASGNAYSSNTTDLKNVFQT